MQKPMTGYPSIDKPQNKYYRQKPIRNIDPKQTVYDAVFNSNCENMDAPALEYMGLVWSFERLKKETDRVADAFLKVGFKTGDVVLVGVSNSPEAVVSLLALNKIGAVSKWIDIRTNEKGIERAANESNCKAVIAFDILLPKIQLVVNNTCLEKIIVVNPVGTLSPVVQLLYALKNKNKAPKDARYVPFWEFAHTGDPNTACASVPFDRNKPSIMIQSSGTTGKAKTIIHSDYSAVTCAQKLAYSDLPLGVGKSILVYLPPWIAYALGDAMIMPLTLGTKVVISPTFEPEKFLAYLGKFSICFTAPFVYRYLKDHINDLNNKQKCGLRKIECLVSGGDKITAEENAELEKALGTVLVNGYGNNEGWGALTVNPTKHNKYGTVGIPKYGDTIIAYDNDSGKELPYGKSGEICALTETMFLSYENNDSETRTVKKSHPDGQVWIHTGDLGFIDQDGFVTLNGRARRVIVRRAFKISAYTIEDAICQHPAVKECVAVSVEDAEEEHVPMAFIVLNDEHKDNTEVAQESIIEMCKNQLKEYEVPKHFRFVESLPYTANGKYDFRKLEEMGNEELNR